MASVDILVRDTIWTWIFPIGVLIWIIFGLSSGKANVIRQWYCTKYLKPFSQLHDELIEPIKKALFADLPDIDSNLVDLRNKGLLRILEIGVGSGANLKYYPQQCRLIVCDPSPHFLDYFRSNIDKFPDINLEKFVISAGERLRTIPPSSVDVVVTTTVLCCVEDVPKVLKEIKRVLVPGGHYYFLEHIYAPLNSKLWKLQRLANLLGVWKWLHDGCRFRRIEDDIMRAGFKDVDMSSFELDSEVDNSQSKLIHMVSPHIVGVAIK